MRGAIKAEALVPVMFPKESSWQNVRTTDCKEEMINHFLMNAVPVSW